MERLKDNLLLQFSLFSIVIMGGLAVIIMLFLDTRLGDAFSLLNDHQTAMSSGISINHTDSFSVHNLSRDVQELRWMTFGVLSCTFAVLYLGLIMIVRRGWKTIIQQRSIMNASNLQSAFLAEIGRIISSSVAIQDVYDRVADEVHKLIPFDRVVISLVDMEHDTFSPAYTTGPEVEGLVVGHIVPMAGSITGEVVRGKKPVLLRPGVDVEWLDRFPAYAQTTGSVIAAPLISQNQAVGSLQMDCIDHEYTERDLALLVSVGNQIAGAVANAQYYEAHIRTEKREHAVAEENKTLANIGRIISSSLDIDDVYAKVTEEARKIIRFDRMSVSFVDFDNAEAIQRYTNGVDIPGRGRGDRIPLVGALAGEVALTGLSQMFEAGSEEEVLNRFPLLLPAFQSGLRSFITVPLVDRDLVTGVFQIRSTEIGAYEQKDILLVERIVAQISGGIANAQQYEKTRKAEEAERLRSEQLGGLLEVARVLNQSGSFGSKVSKVLVELARIGDANSAALRVPTDEGLRRIGCTGIQMADTALLSYQGNIPALVYEKKDMLVINDCPSHPLVTARYVQRGVKSLLAAPIVSQESIVGIVVVNSYEDNHFTPERVSLLLGIINGLGSLLETARLEDQRARAEQDLKESDSQFRQIAENMREAVFLVDHQDNKILYKNDAYEKIWGQTCEALYDNAMIWVDAIHPEDRPKVDAAFINQQSTGEFEEEFRIIWPDGTIRWIFDRAFPILNEAGEVYRLVGIVEDITVRKETEERLRESARLASIGELAAGVAHEINNPLTGVLGYSEMVLSRDIPEEISGEIQTIYQEALRAAKIVQNLLFFARRQDTEKQYLDLNSVLVRALEMKSYDFKVGNIKVVSQLSPKIPKTMLDEHQLVQVFLNILTNAEQAIHQATGNGQISVYTVNSDDAIEITIKDDGPEIPPEVLNRIFEPFFTTKEVGQGTGLGLSISYGIIKQHGGDIWAECVAGEGTTFHICLPVAAPEELAVLQVPAVASTERTTKHILVVDDEPQIRNLLGRYLESERYTVDLADDGHEAWRKLASIDYDCILLDLKMPGMGGPELYKLIQDISEPLASKIVFVTGDTVGPATQEFLSETNNPVVAKPFRMAELLQTIHELWERIPAAV